MLKGLYISNLYIQLLMTQEKMDRRTVLKILGAGVVGFAAGMATGWVARGPSVAPTTKPTEIRIGKTLGMTGPLAVPNAWCRKFYLHVLEIINANGGLYVDDVGEYLPIRLIEYDDRGSTDEAAKYYERLASVDKVHAFLSTYGTFFAPVIDPIAAKYKIPFLMACGMPLPELQSNWTVWSTPIVFSIEILEILEKVGVSDIAIATIETKFGIEFRKYFLEGFSYGDEVYPGAQERGFNIVVDKWYPIGTTDFTSILLEVKDKNPDAFIQFSYPDDAYACTKQMIELDVNPKFYYTALGLANPEFFRRFTPEELNGVCLYLQAYVPSAPWRDPYLGSCMEAYQKFLDRWGAIPDINDTNNAWVTSSLLYQAIEKAGTLDGEAIIEVLRTEKFQTLYGEMKFDEYGIVTKDYPSHYAYVGQWQTEGAEELTGKELQTVSPLKWKTADIIYPKPKWPK